MRKINAAAVVILVIGAIFRTAQLTYAEEGASVSPYKKYANDALSFEFPSTWKSITGKDLAGYKSAFQAQLSQQARSLGYQGAEDFKLTSLGAISAEEQEVLGVFFSTMIIPEKLKGKYLDIIYKSVKDQIYSRYPKVLRCEMLKLNDIPAMVTHVQTANGATIINYILYPAGGDNGVISISIIGTAEKYSQYAEEVNRIIGTLQLKP